MFSLLQYSSRLNRHRSVQSENDSASGKMDITCGHKSKRSFGGTFKWVITLS